MDSPPIRGRYFRETASVTSGAIRKSVSLGPGTRFLCAAIPYRYALIGEVEDIFTIKLCKALADFPYMALVRPGEMREGRSMRRSRFGCRNCKLRKLKVCTCPSSALNKPVLS